MKVNQFLLVFVLLVLLAVAIVPGTKAASLTVDGAGSCNDGTGSPAYCTIQAAVDAAAPNDTINVNDATYTEQVIIDKDLSLVGSGSATIIQAFASMPVCAVSSYDWHAVVCVINGADVTISDLTVDGAGQGNNGTNNRFMGVAFRNAGGTVDNLMIKDVRDTPFSGVQHGVALNLYNDDTVARTIDVTNNDFTGFQKNAMALTTGTATTLDVLIQGNMIQGAGETDVTAQNGIQVYEFGGSLTGTIDNNTVSGIGYDNTNASTPWVATSILNYYAHVDITNNVVTNGHVGIYNYDAEGTNADNDITIEKIGISAYGIIATDPPEAVPSPFVVTESNSNANESNGESATNALLTMNITDNTVTFSGGDNSDTFGIEADSGYGVDDLSITANGNNVSGFDIGFEIYQCQSGCDTGVFTDVTANNNCITDNNIGLRSNVSGVDASGNWWGDASGPYNATSNPTGLGDPVEGDAYIDGWLDACGGSATGNFYNETADTYHATMQSAVDNASPGDVIEPVGTGPFGSEGSANVTTGGVTINLNGGTFGPGSPAFTISAPDVIINGPGTLDGGGSGDPAVLVTAGGDNFTLQGVEVTDWEDGVQIDSSVISFKLVENFIHDNADAGLQIDAAVTLSGIITIEGNLFKDNGGNGVQNDSGAPVDAKYNSWGIDTGPDFGDGISDDVNAEPWTFAEIYFDVDPPTDATQRDVSEDETFDVDLVVDGENLYGLSFLYTYDPDLLTLDNTAFASPWDTRCFLIAGSPAGTVEYVCNLLTEPEWDGGKLATLTFTADLPGTAPGDDGPWQNLFDISHLETDTSAGAVGGVKVFVNNAGFNAPTDPDRDITDANDGQIDIDGTANYTGFVDLQGKPNDSGAMVTVYDQALKSGATALADATSAASGHYLTTYIPPYLMNVGMNYWFQIDAPRYLPTTAVQMEPASGDPIPTEYQHSHILDDRPETALNNVVLLGGDSTDNDAIDINDATCMGASYETTPPWTCTGGPGASADVNDDNVVNILDLVLMGGNYGLAASPWTP